MMEAVRTSEMFVFFNGSTRRHYFNEPDTSLYSHGPMGPSWPRNNYSGGSAGVLPEALAVKAYVFLEEPMFSII
jgi:hypothetical protein